VPSVRGAAAALAAPPVRPYRAGRSRSRRDCTAGHRTPNRHGTALLLTSCAGGRHAQTTNQTPAIDGSNGHTGALQLHIVAIRAPADGTTFYTAGSNAGMNLAIVNTGTTADILTGISTAAATGWGVFGSDVVVPIAAVTDSAAGGAASSTGAATLPAPITSVAIPAENSISFGVPAATRVLLLLGLTNVLHTGNSVPVTFTFKNAAPVTIPVPVQIARTPAGSTVPPVSASP
jgi:copper(I)-binding protein